MSYSVKQLAELSGVSVRTLHHYDELGLLNPSVRNEAGYRKYGDQELLRLQQILFYKELDFPLKEIMEILDDPDFNLEEALNNHRKMLKEKRNRMDVLLVTIDKTIQQLKQKNMTPDDLYQGFPKAREYRDEAIEEFGEGAVKQSENFLKKLGKEGLKKLVAEQVDNRAKLVALSKEDPASAAVQKEIALHYNIIRQFWGTVNSPDKQAEAYTGLGQLYVHDERYTMVDGVPQPEFAKFMSEAMKLFAERSLR
ncbi:MAG: MerR family transcriptional regulator [Flavobacteriales bacterium]